MLIFFIRNTFYLVLFVSSIMYASATKNVTDYQDSVPYDSFLYKDGQKKLGANQNADSGKTFGSLVTKRGKLYVIDCDMKLAKNVNWGNNIKLLMSTSWSNTSISIIVIKHPQNKPITIEGTNKQKITLGKGIILDIQSPVTFKNVQIHRAPDSPDSGIYQYGKKKKVCQLGSYGLYSSAVVVRAPVKFENCVLSTSNGGGVWSDVHCITPGNSTMEFYNNTYQIKHIYVNCNKKGSVASVFKTNERSKLQPLISVAGGNKNNIAITSSMLSDLDNNSNTEYVPVGNFNKNGKVFYVASYSPRCVKGEDGIWYCGVDDTSDLSGIKQNCVKFLQKYCKYPSDKNDVNIEVCNTTLSEQKTVTQLIGANGYIDTDMTEESGRTFPTTDWSQTIKAGILPISTSSETADINVGLIGKQSLKIQTPTSVRTLRINGDWSKYIGELTLPNNVSKVYVSSKDIPFGIVASHNFELDVTNSKTNELCISGDLSKCTGTVSFSSNISKISLATDKPTFSIGGSSNLTIGPTNQEINKITLKKDILKRKGTVSTDASIKTVSIE